MAIFPKIQSPCPYKGDISAITDGDVCRLCKRQVFDLTHMSDGERVAFMEGCSDQVCVTYKIPVRPVLAAVVLAAAVAAPMAAAACDATDSEVVVVTGGIKDPRNVEYVQAPADSSVPELPIVYEASGAKSSTHTNGESTAPSGQSASPAAP